MNFISIHFESAAFDNIATARPATISTTQHEREEFLKEIEMNSLFRFK